MMLKLWQVLKRCSLVLIALQPLFLSSVLCPPFPAPSFPLRLILKCPERRGRGRMKRSGFKGMWKLNLSPALVSISQNSMKSHRLGIRAKGHVTVTSKSMLTAFRHPGFLTTYNLFSVQLLKIITRNTWLVCENDLICTREGRKGRAEFQHKLMHEN